MSEELAIDDVMAKLDLSKFCDEQYAILKEQLDENAWSTEMIDEITKTLQSSEFSGKDLVKQLAREQVIDDDSYTMPTGQWLLCLLEAIFVKVPSSQRAVFAPIVTRGMEFSMGRYYTAKYGSWRAMRANGKSLRHCGIGQAVFSDMKLYFRITEKEAREIQKLFPVVDSSKFVLKPVNEYEKNCLAKDLAEYQYFIDNGKIYKPEKLDEVVPMETTKTVSDEQVNVIAQFIRDQGLEVNNDYLHRFLASEQETGAGRKRHCL